MIPKIKFIYSDVYDSVYRDSFSTEKFSKKYGKKYPSEKKILDYISEIEPLWKKHGKKILEKLSEIMNLRWKEE